MHSNFLTLGKGFILRIASVIKPKFPSCPKIILEKSGPFDILGQFPVLVNDP